LANEEILMSTMEAKDVLSVGSRLSWAAILAGAVLAITLYIVFSVLGLCIGLSVSHRIEGGQLGVGAAIYAVITLLLSLFIGGYVTSQSTVGETKGEAVRYGLLLWGVILIAMAWFSSVGLGLGFGSLLNQTMRAPGQEATAAAPLWSAEELKKAGLNDEQIDKLRQAREGIRAQVGKLDLTTEAWWSLFGLVLSIAAAVAGTLAGAGPSLSFRRVRTSARVQPG
jgi:hypothetical protein